MAARVERWLAPGSVALLGALLLLPFVGLDPARGMTFSNAPFSDEAWNLVGARNVVLFGHPSMDEWRTWLLAVPFMVLHAAAFAIFGVDLVVARLVGIATVVLTAALIVGGLAPLVGRQRAWLAGVALVTSSLALYYGRLAFLEPLVGLFLAAGVLSLGPARRGAAARWGIAGGSALALAVMTKGLAVAPAGAVVIVATAAAWRRPWARRWLAGSVLSGTLVGGAWLLAVVWPHRRAVGTILSTVYPPFQLPGDLATLIDNLARFPFADGALPFSLPLVTLAGLGLVRLLRRGAGPADGSPDGRVVPAAAVAGLAAGIAVLAIVDYQPNRYVVAFLPLAAIPGAWALPGDLTGARRPVRRRAWLATSLAAALVATPGIALHGATLLGGGSQVQAIQAAARRALPPGVSIAGQYAPLVAMGLPVRTVVPFETVNGGDLYADGVRYLIWIDGGPSWMKRHPEAWAGRRILGCMSWSKVPTRSCLYALPDAP